MAAAKVFLSYAHEDDAHRAALVDHLTPLIDAGVLQVWHDRQIQPGADWSTEIDTNLENAGLVLLLVSRHFMASDYCKGIEVKRALERRAQGLTQVVPVILSSCRWTRSPIGKLQALPTDGKPITEAAHPDQLYTAVVEGLERLLEPRSPTSAQPQLQPLLFSQPLSPPPPWWRRPLPASLALGALVLLMVGGLTVGWLERVRAEVRADLRLDRSDLAAQRLAQAPWAGALLPADLGETVALYRRSQVAVADRAPDLRALDALLQRRPQDADLLFLRARWGYDAGDLDATRRDAQAAVTADPQHAAAHNLLGLVADALVQSAPAEAHYRAAMEAAPHEPQFAANRARALLDLGRADEALQAFGRLDHYTRALAEQALAHWALGQWTQALESQTRALERLRQPPAGQAPETQYNWEFFTAPGHGVSLAGDDRRCYVAHAQAVTQVLRDGGAVGAEVVLPGCADPLRLDAVREVIGADLCRYVIARQPARAEVARRLRRGWLGQTQDCPAPVAAGPAT